MKAEKLKGLKLYQALPFMDYPVKIGCDQGTGFVYCGEVPKAIELHDIDLILIQEQKKNLENTKKTLEALIKQITELEQKIQKGLDNVYSKQSRMNNRKHLLQRRILDAYKSIDEKGAYIIKIEGDDKGSYWTSNEYKTGKVETDE